MTRFAVMDPETRGWVEIKEGQVHAFCTPLDHECIDVQRLTTALIGTLPGRWSMPDGAEWELHCREVAERIEELL